MGNCCGSTDKFSDDAPKLPGVEEHLREVDRKKRLLSEECPSLLPQQPEPSPPSLAPLVPLEEGPLPGKPAPQEVPRLHEGAPAVLAPHVDKPRSVNDFLLKSIAKNTCCTPLPKPPKPLPPSDAPVAPRAVRGATSPLLESGKPLEAPPAVVAPAVSEPAAVRAATFEAASGGTGRSPASLCPRVEEEDFKPEVPPGVNHTGSWLLHTEEGDVAAFLDDMGLGTASLVSERLAGFGAGLTRLYVLRTGDRIDTVGIHPVTGARTVASIKVGAGQQEGVDGVFGECLCDPHWDGPRLANTCLRNAHGKRMEYTLLMDSEIRFVVDMTSQGGHRVFQTFKRIDEPNLALGGPSTL